MLVQTHSVGLVTAASLDPEYPAAFGVQGATAHLENSSTAKAAPHERLPHP
jgi:hypothetical protein